MQTLHVHTGRRYPVSADGEPFFLSGGTARELFHTLHREEASFSLRTRQSQGFHMIRAVVPAEPDGLETPGACGRGMDAAVILD